ncbi:LLM class flavin-dependent oxidoreductase [Corynebacterium lactis]|uniref:Alkanal monooxygenase n=1 Tax=Corynebacterium lactis RW2-5 TaxID=1408189 RepID=A0A0K2GXG5_9CORY|nr:LLM class flavin-dependent oxidoreductase [Corynebacterium lactis]ALA66484.1 alkanal monooxygenase [Corynebacterium lactis RW2-5]
MIRTESILDLATVARGQSHAEALKGSIDLAQTAENVGYQRIWYAEHHNMNSIASSAPAVLIAAVGAHTERIKLGSGGVMLPNHAPLTVAEQFGTLANLYPGRIELGLGRAPGTDQTTMRALRRDHRAADTFPQDVQELQGYLSDETRIPGINAIPGRGTHVPLYILGSSLFGAQLAAALGLPYAFASHFAPDAMLEAIAAYREQFRPSEQLDSPRAFATLNVIAAETEEDAKRQHFQTRRNLVKRFLGRGAGPGEGRRLTDDEAEMLMDTPQGRHVQNMFRHTAVGTVAQVRSQIAEFGEFSTADELIVAHQSPSVAERLRSVELTAEAAGLS